MPRQRRATSREAPFGWWTWATSHHRVDILRFERKRKKPIFEVAGDLASVRRGYRGSNEDLEDELRAEAKRVKKKIAWSSENDMLVGRAADVDTCRWIIDRALGGPAA